MTTQAIYQPTIPLHRIELEARIIRRLQQLDYDLLQQLDIATQQAAGLAQEQARVEPAGEALPAGKDKATVAPATVAPATAAPALTRRQLFTRLAAGGAVLVAAGVAVNRPQAVGQESESNSAGEVMAGQQILLDLYETMDRIGLDRLILTALAAMGVSLNGLRLGATALRRTVDLIDGLVERFEAVVPTIVAGIEAVEGFLQTVDGHIADLERLIGNALEEAAPLTEAVDRFFQKLLSYLPFGIGERIQQAAQEMAAAVNLLPRGARLLRQQIVSPLRTWFPVDEAADMRAVLFAPARRDLLAPARTLLDDLVAFSARWEEELQTPIAEAVARRDEIRSQIAEYKARTPSL